MFMTGSSASFTIIAFIVSIAIVLGGLLFSWLSKSSDKVKRIVSFVMYIWGAFTTILNAPQVWRIINGTFVEPEVSAIDGFGDTLSNIFSEERQDIASDYIANDILPSTIEIFNMSISVVTFASGISIGVGLLTVMIGLIFRKKNWAKVVILGGIITIVIGSSQLLRY